MSQQASILEYKCPCCDAGLNFSETQQKLTCEYCGTSFELDAVRAYNQTTDISAEPEWEEPQGTQWSDDEQSVLRNFICPSCGGEILSDENTAATFCPFCSNPTILSQRLSGGLKPDAIIPFKATKEAAKASFLKMCKGKPLLPKGFANEQRVEKITGIYVPFWVYNCGSKQEARYKATRVRRWSDSQYIYTRTDHFLLFRGASAQFDGIPMDGSSKMDNAIMESIEPFDYSQMVDFDTVYLTGFFADKYDVEANVGHERVRQRVNSTMDSMLQSSLMGYATAIPTENQIQIQHGKAKYVLLPVWMLHSKYKDKTYVFAMNGQTGKMTGTFPICPKRSTAWFAGICAAVTTVVSLIQWFAL